MSTILKALRRLEEEEATQAAAEAAPQKSSDTESLGSDLLRERIFAEEAAAEAAPSERPPRAQLRDAAGQLFGSKAALALTTLLGLLVLSAGAWWFQNGRSGDSGDRPRVATASAPSGVAEGVTDAVTQSAAGARIERRAPPVEVAAVPPPPTIQPAPQVSRPMPAPIAAKRPETAAAKSIAVREPVVVEPPKVASAQPAAEPKRGLERAAVTPTPAVLAALQRERTAALAAQIAPKASPAAASVPVAKRQSTPPKPMVATPRRRPSAQKVAKVQPTPARPSASKAAQTAARTRPQPGREPSPAPVSASISRETARADTRADSQRSVRESAQAAAKVTESRPERRRTDWESSPSARVQDRPARPVSPAPYSSEPSEASKPSERSRPSESFTSSGSTASPSVQTIEQWDSTDVVVLRTSWHPSADRRSGKVRVRETGEELTLHEGDAVGNLVVREISPSSIVFQAGEVELRRRVGAR